MSGLNHMEIPLGFSYNLKVLFKLQPAFSTTNNVHKTKNTTTSDANWADHLITSKWDSRVYNNHLRKSTHLPTVFMIIQIQAAS